MTEWLPNDDGTADIYESTVAGTTRRPVAHTEVSTVADAADALEIDVSAVRAVDMTLTEECTLSIVGARTGRVCELVLVLRQDGAGSQTVVWPAGTVWASGTAPTLTVTASAVDIVRLFTVDGGSEWVGEAVALDVS